MNPKTAKKQAEKVALFVPSLRGGGAERVMVNLALGFAERGIKVDLVLAKAEGPYLSEVPRNVGVVDLKARRVLYSLPGLVRYLRAERPKALLSAMGHANIIALWAKELSGSRTRVVFSVHNTHSQSIANASTARAKLMPLLIQWFYPQAYSVVTVSHGVRDDLLSETKLLAKKVKVIYNPVVTPELLARTEEPLEHPWFATGEPPVVLSVGRLTRQKDYPTLIRAFALVRKERSARLMILGEGEDRQKLEAVIGKLGLEADVALPGFVDNPYKYMKRAAVFVLSSRWEGFGNVLVEAMAAGTPVISTDCHSGPAEILEGGRWGRLVPVGDAEKLADAILTSLTERWCEGARTAVVSRFSLENIVKQYENILIGVNRSEKSGTESPHIEA